MLDLRQTFVFLCRNAPIANQVTVAADIQSGAEFQLVQQTSGLDVPSSPVPLPTGTVMDAKFTVPIPTGGCKYYKHYFINCDCVTSSKHSTLNKTYWWI